MGEVMRRLVVFFIACSLVSVGFQPRDLSLAMSRSMFLTSPFQPLPPSARAEMMENYGKVSDWVARVQIVSAIVSGAVSGFIASAISKGEKRGSEVF